MPRKAVGHHRWAIAAGYIPGWSHGPEPEMLSHATACILNTNGRNVIMSRDLGDEKR